MQLGKRHYRLQLQDDLLSIAMKNRGTDPFGISIKNDNYV